eukprot:755825-Hanusia_phi.AAC.1
MSEDGSMSPRGIEPSSASPVTMSKQLSDKIVKLLQEGRTNAQVLKHYTLLQEVERGLKMEQIEAVRSSMTDKVNSEKRKHTEKR